MGQYFQHKSMLDFLLSQEKKFSDRISHSIKVNKLWINYTYKSTINSAFGLAASMQAKGVIRGDRVFIISRNRPEFCFSFFSCALLGAVAIPVDPRMNLKDLQFIYGHSSPKAIIILNDDDINLAHGIVGLQNATMIFQAKFIHDEINYKRDIDLDLSFNPEDLALIIYTSGTTSRPKGVMISFNNIFFQVDTLVKNTFYLKDDLRYLSILPLNHMFEFTTGMLIPFVMGGEVCYSNSLFPLDIIAALKEKKIREMVCVPLFLKMLRKGIETKMHEKKLTKKYFELGMKLTEKEESKFLRKFYFFPIHVSFGGELRRLISGGSSLDKETEKFFTQLGFLICQGYGLTETSPAVTSNTKENMKYGSVGKAIPGVQIKLDEVNGEILVRGPLVMKGYFRDQELTDEVIDQDGWFHTGDLGNIDEQGFLTITGRIKELIVLPNGKKVAPNDVEEELLKNNPYIKEACVIGLKAEVGAMRGIEEVCAVVVPHDNYGHVEDKVLLELLRVFLLEISPYKRPARIIIQRHELEKTATLKIKRMLIKTQLEISFQNKIAKKSTQYYFMQAK